MKLWIDAEVLRLTNLRASAAAKPGNPGPEGSVAKLALAELNKAIYELCIDLLGADRRSSTTTTRSGAPTTSALEGAAGDRPQDVPARRGPTRSRAARRRSCATSSASGSSACPASPASTRTCPGARSPATDLTRA